jgi:PKD repeat protein
MVRIFFLVLAYFLVLNISAQESDNTWRCHTDVIYNELIKDNPEILQIRYELEEFTREFVTNPSKSDDLYIIPIVFHIVHDYGPENVSFEQIEEAVEFMNKDFRLMRDDTATIVSEFKTIAADTQIEFRLAKKDPWGDCTNGVTRTHSQATYGGGELAKQAAPSWPRSQYLNVWIVRSLPHGAAGWAYYPGTAPDGTDGIIMLHNYLGSIGTSSLGRASTLTHEVGHYLNLAHPWGSTNDPGLPSNCDIDDWVEDTPNTIGWSSCVQSGTSCGSLDNVQNFMEYSYCGRMYTYGQGLRMQAALNSHASQRNNLWTESNLIATGLHESSPIETCPPIADFDAEVNSLCSGATIQFNNMTYNTLNLDSVYWDLPGTETGFSNDYNAEVVYNQAGVYNVGLYVENEADSDIKNINDYVFVFDKNDAITIPYVESIETNIFPFLDNNKLGFYLYNEGPGNWHQTNIASYSGESSVRIRTSENRDRASNIIMLPIIDMGSADHPLEVSFYAAYADINSNSEDRIKIYISEDCGETKKLIHIISSFSLNSGGLVGSQDFIPTIGQWKEHSFTVSPQRFDNQYINLIIESESGGGNYLYLDNFSYFNTATVTEIKEDKIVSAFPNPFSNQIIIELYDISARNELVFYNSAGQEIARDYSENKFYDAWHIFESQSPGLYFVKVSEGDNYSLLKLIRQ